MSTTIFRPKKFVVVNGEVLREFLSSATEAIARGLLRPLAPLLVAGSHVHDNGCGAGAITEAIFSSHSAGDASSIQISATDINAAALASLQAKAEEKGWPVHIGEMDCRTLSFADDTFSHSFTSFVFLQVWRDDARCAREIYRTLRPGGPAVVTTWEELATMSVFRQAYQRLYGESRELPEMLQTHWYDGKHVMKAMVEAGFGETTMKVERYSTQVRIEDERRWCEIGWSICGAAQGRWTQEDEDAWDEAIAVAQDALITSPWYQRDMENKSKGWLQLTASVLVAEKCN